MRVVPSKPLSSIMFRFVGECCASCEIIVSAVIFVSSSVGNANTVNEIQNNYDNRYCIQ